MSSFSDLGGEVIANANQKAVYEKKGGIHVKDGLSLTDGGKGLTAGFIKCALCNVKSMKKYAFGRGFSAHLQAVHKISGNEEAHDEAVKLSLPSLSAPGLNRKGEKQADYKDCLPRVCATAKAGNAVELRRLMEFDPELVRDDQDKFGANALDWAAGEGHVECVSLLLPLFHPTISKPSLEDVLQAEEDREIEKEGHKKRLKRRDGKSCLHWACRNGHNAVVAYLVDNLYSSRALHKLGTGDGTTPVHIACFGGMVDMLHFLYDRYCMTDSSGELLVEDCIEERKSIDTDTQKCLSGEGVEHNRNNKDNEDNENNEDDDIRKELFAHVNNWGCYPEHFACMSAKSGPALFSFFVDRVHGGDKKKAAEVFFLRKNAENMTPVHKWLLYFCKEDRDVHHSLHYLADLRSHLEIESTPSTTASQEEDASMTILSSHYAALELVDADTDLQGTSIVLVESIKEGDIKRAYRELSKKYHPDRLSQSQAQGYTFIMEGDGDNDSGKEKEQEQEQENFAAAAKAKMHGINEAYAVLGDPVSRASYDELLMNRDAHCNAGSDAASSGNLPPIPRDILELIEDRLKRYSKLTPEEREHVRSLMN